MYSVQICIASNKLQAQPEKLRELGVGGGLNVWLPDATSVRRIENMQIFFFCTKNMLETCERWLLSWLEWCGWFLGRAWKGVKVPKRWSKKRDIICNGLGSRIVDTS